MAYSPIIKKKLSDNQILKGISKLKSLKKEEIQKEKNISNSSLKHIQLNLQNFISKALENNSNETKYFDINQELEEIENTKKNQLKEEESFTKLKTKYPIGDQIFTYDDINTNTLIGLNLFKQRKNSFNNSYYNSKISNFKKQTLDSTEKKRLESLVKDKCKKRNSEQLKFDKNNINNNKSNNNNINNNKCNFTSCSSSNYFDLTSPKSSKNKFSTTLISLKNDYLPIIDKDMNNIKKKKIVKYASLSKVNSPIKNLSQNFLQWRKKRGKIKENLKAIKKQREKTQEINKKKLYERLIKNCQNEKKKLFDSSIIGLNNNAKVIKTKTFASKTNIFKDIRKQSELKDKNDIRNIINISENQYNEFSKYCSQIKEKLFFSSEGTIKKKSTRLSQKKIEKILNESNNNEISEKKNKSNTMLLSIIEQKKYLEEGFQENEIGSNRIDINKFKENQ